MKTESAKTGVSSKIRKQARDRERRFRQMTPEQKRVTIAKDVIAALQSKKIKPQTSIYTSLVANKAINTSEPEKQLQDVLLSLPTCSACAIGSMFVCTVIRHDQLKIDDLGVESYKSDRWDAGKQRYVSTTNRTNRLNEREYLDQYLKKFFTFKQLTLIETAFERWNPAEGYEDELKDTGRWKAFLFGKQYQNTKARMVAIMSNIITNNGVFVP